MGDTWRVDDASGLIDLILENGVFCGGHTIGEKKWRSSFFWSDLTIYDQFWGTCVVITRYFHWLFIFRRNIQDKFPRLTIFVSEGSAGII